MERENSISCETQLEYCRAIIRPEEKQEEVFTFVDNGFSGGNVDRDGFRQMMHLVREGRIRKIIVYRLDRISRSLSDFMGILETLKENDVVFVSSQESFDTGSPYGEMIVKILMVFAEFERQSIIERITQAYLHRSGLGIYMGGRRPYGFRFSNTSIHGIRTKMLSADEKEIGHIRYIFRQYAQSGVTLRRLMDDLNQKGMLPKEGSWSAAKLSVILKNPIYVRADNRIYEYFAGRRADIISKAEQFDGIHGIQLYGQTKHSREDWSDIRVVVMPHEGVVPAEIWLRCQKKLAENRQIGNSVSNTTSWLGGMMICKSCGRTMTVTKGGKRADGSRIRYFSCTGKSHNRICEGPDVTLYADSLEEMVFRLIGEKLSGLKDLRIRSEPENPERLNRLKNRLTEIRNAQMLLTERILEPGIDSDLMKLMNEKARTLAAEAETLKAEADAMEADSGELIATGVLEQRWQNAEYEDRKAVCRLLIDRILLHRDGTAEVVWNL